MHRQDEDRRRAVEAEPSGEAPLALSDPGLRRPGLIFAVLVGGCLLLAGGYLAWTLVGKESGGKPASASSLRGLMDTRSFVMFQHVARDGNYAKVALAPGDGGGSARAITGLTCERVHFAADRGLCLVPEPGLIEQEPVAKIFGSDMRTTRKIELNGIISRARVSPDGRYGAATTFLQGHSYADTELSTATVLIDMARGRSLGNLETFGVTLGGKPLENRDVNFWGVTFARDSNRFYATLRSGGKTYLLEGDIAARRARVLRENVECPSLSPDNTRIAYKSAVGRGKWRFHVLDLATSTDVPLAEARSVDDQVEWLDDRRILYGLAADVWAAPADGRGRPRKYLPNALSPAVSAPGPSS